MSSWNWVKNTLCPRPVYSRRQCRLCKVRSICLCWFRWVPLQCCPIGYLCCFGAFFPARLCISAWLGPSRSRHGPWLCVDFGLFLFLVLGSQGARCEVPCMPFGGGRGRSPGALHTPFGCLWRRPQTGSGRLCRPPWFLCLWLPQVFWWWLLLGCALRFPFGLSHTCWWGTFTVLCLARQWPPHCVLLPRCV